MWVGAERGGWVGAERGGCREGWVSGEGVGGRVGIRR